MDGNYIALGSNLGNRQTNLNHAIERIGMSVNVVGVSPYYQSPSFGWPDGPDFLNAVLRFQTKFNPHQVMHLLLDIEKQFGRVRTDLNAPRTLDLDLLAFGSVTLDSDLLTLPHPRLWDRLFVLLPLADVAPEFRHPRTAAAIRHRINHLKAITKVEDVPKLFSKLDVRDLVELERAQQPEQT